MYLVSTRTEPAENKASQSKGEPIMEGEEGRKRSPWNTWSSIKDEPWDASVQ